MTRPPKPGATLNARWVIPSRESGVVVLPLLRDDQHTTKHRFNGRGHFQDALPDFVRIVAGFGGELLNGSKKELVQTAVIRLPLRRLLVSQNRESVFGEQWPVVSQLGWPACWLCLVVPGRDDQPGTGTKNPRALFDSGSLVR